MAKADYMMSILWILQNRTIITAKELSEELEISIRSVYRYVDALCASGVPIIAESGHKGGYRLMERFKAAPLVFDPDEQRTLAQAAQFAQEAGYPYPDHLSRAVSKLKTYIGPEQLETVLLHEKRMGVIFPEDPTAQEQLRQLDHSAAAGITILMEYLSGKEAKPKERRLNPYGIVQWKNNWYVVGYCHERQAIRSFRVDRIKSLRLTDDTFEQPPSFSAGAFFMDSLLPSSAGNLPSVTVRISGQEQALNELCRHWMFSRMLVHRSDGEAVFSLPEDSVRTYVPYFLLPYGKAVSVLEPLELKHKMVEVLTSLLEHYRQSLVD
ncbi:helix-turn-helix transcriptional regulator [Paenibacillus tuaregi]|uniref:helix-turn-helix transcriptional regulator n=1 Tax=Paenibacillus tuaregi TaxID=1816681 RepID=UPI0008386357|nr:WYL domain-containing protein [Paenibacillus tuaregi]